MDKKWVKIPEVLFFQEGPGVRNTQYTTSGIKLLNVANLVDGQIDLSTSSRYISEKEAYGIYKHFLCDVGDFIVASSGIKVEYIDKKMGFVKESMLPLCMNTSTIRFKVLNKDILRIKYFMYYIKSLHFKNQLSQHITGSAQLNYGPSHLKKMVIPLVDIASQDYIINRLDLLSELIEKRKEQIKKLDLLIKSRFIEMFGTEEEPKYKIIEISNFAKVWSSKRIYANEYVEKGIPFYRSKEIRELGDGFSPSTELFISIDRYNDIKMKFGIPKKGDILIAAIGATIGFLWQINTDNPFYYKDGNLICISDMKNNNSTYIRFALSKAIDKIKKKSVYGTAQIALTIEKVEKIKLSIPPIELQNEFAEFVEKVDKLEKSVKTHLEKLETLKKSLMQQYFG